MRVATGVRPHVKYLCRRGKAVGTGTLSTAESDKMATAIRGKLMGDIAILSKARQSLSRGDRRRLRFNVAANVKATLYKNLLRVLQYKSGMYAAGDGRET